MSKLPEDFNTKICNAALEYAENGWSVFPLSVDTKRPLGKWKKYQTEIATEEEIYSWETNGAPKTEADTGEIYDHAKYFNIALVTGAISGIVVVDCDNEDAITFAEKNGLTSPVFVKTTRGKHFYFKHPNNGKRFRNKVGSNPGGTWHAVDGLDFRGDGGYVIAPPSVSLHDNNEIKHEYVMHIPEGVYLDELPVWKGDADDFENIEQFDLATLSLADIDIGKGVIDIREQVRQRVLHLGRKLVGPDCGDSTDDWMIKFAGQMARRGLDGNELWFSICAFHEEFFTYNGTPQALERWLRTKMRSAMEMDRRSHPEDYDPITRERLSPSKVDSHSLTEDMQEEERDIELKPIYSEDFDRLLDGLGDVDYHVEPILPSRSIVQVIGYNGHGKSFFTGNVLTALASNRPQFGSYYIGKPAKVLYLDFDNPARTVLNRFKGFKETHGDPRHNLAIWSPAIIPQDAGGVMNLREEEGLKTLERWLKLLNPDVVVIDTVRNAFGGMDENSPQHWFHVNKVSKIIRDVYKATVVLVHHRNKPSDTGLGREAGSTAQLTDLDVQIIITQVYKDKEVSKTKAGLHDDECIIERQGRTYTPFEYFEAKITQQKAIGEKIKMISQVSFGKVREETELHNTTYIAYTQNINTGKNSVFHIPSLKEDAIHMQMSGRAIVDISRDLFVSIDQLERWFGLKK